MGKADDFVILGNGVLKSKQVLEAQAQARKESASAANGGKPGAHGPEGDNGGDGNINKRTAPETDPTNQRPE